MPPKPVEKQTVVKTKGGNYVTDPRKKKLTHADLIDRLHRGRDARRPFERDWWLNLAYLNGDQYVQFIDETQRLIVQDATDDDVRSVNNQMLKIQRIERAKMLRTVPSPKAIPGHDGSMEAEETARILTAYMDKVQHDTNFSRRLRQVTWWVTATGNCFLKWMWDEGQKCPVIEVVNPFEVIVDPFADRFEDCRWWIHEQFLSEEDAWDAYGDHKGAHVEHLNVGRSEKTSGIEERIFSDLGIGQAQLEGVTVYEYWEPPRKNFPGHYYVFTTSGIVVDTPTEYPYVHNKAPFTHVGHIERSSSKYCASVQDSMRPMQDELNRAENQIIQNRNLADGKWFVPAEIELDQDIRAEPRQVIHVKSGAPGVIPQLVSYDPLPNWVKDEPARISGQMGDLAMQHEVSQGSVPGRVDSGSAIQLLQESDDSVMRDAIDSLEQAIKYGFTMVIQYVKAHGDRKIIVETYDPESEVSVSELLTDSIPVEQRVEMQTQNALPMSIAGKWDRVSSLVEMQVIPPEAALKMLDLSVAEPSLDPTMIDRKRAYRQNKQMAKAQYNIDEQGMPELVKGDPPPKPERYDNHLAELEVHTTYMKTTEFDKLPEPNKAAFMYHVSLHEQMLAEMQAPAEGELPPGEAPPEGESGPPPPPQ